MMKLERDSQRLVIQSGPTKVVLDKVASKATLEHKSFPWGRDPSSVRFHQSAARG
jgi:hypothetical protein